jgi:predicted GNAT family acetyltransferase
MDTSPVQLNVIENKTTKHFEAKVNGHLAFIEYKRSGDNIYLTHTEVPTELEGKGIAKKLVEMVLGIIEAEGKLLVPLCPYVAAYLKRHPEWKRIVAPEFNV